jgi:hypothetical protein
VCSSDLIYQSEPSICEFNLTETNSTDSFQTNNAVFLTTQEGTDCDLENVIDYVESIQPRFAILGTYSTVLVKYKKMHFKTMIFS